ncbi:alpha/beta fold hydrolase [Planctomicrobium piriforme]|uniref:Uncharacterized protein with an alpha/beta hydrolase fold n=1 Tax=Planctomicrobium piriforme TaxID=1576369 RepID=A0A1I3C4W0_9PLAN|nr:alpha/beta fold hydrolase [Planctomicrobium piriforme]SFH69366.1 Uncharacterized protein with an alpha/beta hydrolase fold [Planctomicrobium piriforme]
MRFWTASAAWLLLCIGLTAPALAQVEEADAPGLMELMETEEMFSSLQKLNTTVSAMSGRNFKQPWGDVCFFQGYCLQEHVLSKDCRLLDPAGRLCACGTREVCDQELARLKTEKHLAPMSGRAVIFIHGITRTSLSFNTFAEAARLQGLTVVGFDYPSTRCSIVESALYLKRTLASLEGIDRIDLVVHSMGGLLVRTYLQQTGPDRDPRLHRLVMLGVPNRGARMANLMQNNWVFKWTFGPAGQQLVEDANGFVAALPTPDFPFAVIAGARGTPDGWNMLIPGDDDGTVSVESTRLPGAADFMTINALHSTMMWNKEVIDATLRFLNTGALRESGIPEPIPLTAETSE